MPSVRIKAVGDIMFGDRPLMLGFGGRSRFLETPAVGALAYVAPVLRDCDLAIGNLECVLSEHGRRERDLASLQMRGSPRHARELREAGFGVLSVANNHMMQHGPEAFRETVALLGRAGLQSAGVADGNGRPVPVLLKRKGLTLCILACSLHPEKYHRPVLYAQGPVERLAEDVRSAANRADAVIVCLHWGDEFVSVPSPQQRRAGRLLIESGAALLLGHHPHVLQGVERIGPGAIAYSLGNFVFDFVQEKPRQSVILDLHLDGQGVQRLQPIPVRINDHHRPVPLLGLQAAAWQRQFDRLCRRLDAFHRLPAAVPRYRLLVRWAEKSHQFRNRVLFIRQMPRYERWVVRQSLANFVGARWSRAGKGRAPWSQA